MEVYIDDMLVKLVKVENHLDYLRKTFNIIERYMKMLYPNKCTFGVAAELFLGHVLMHRN